MAVTAKEVNELRKKTGAGMMDCKKVLTETNGDFEEAAKLLKERGLAVAAKKADRITAEGLVDIITEGSDPNAMTAAMIEVNAETDFVVKNELFREFVRGCASVVLKEQPADAEELLNKQFSDGSGNTVDIALKNLIAQIKENITIRRFVTVEGSLSTYIHNKGTIGVIVKADADEKVAADPGFAEFKKNLALQIASMGADYIVRDDVPASVIENERAQILEEIKEDPDNAKKPENVIEKMVEGRIRKFYENKCLLEQGYVKEDKMTVAEYIAGYGRQTGGAVKVAEFHRYEKGEGIQKREENYAEEIAKLTGQAK
ncbi:MAG: translation elongation factor Ts [Oscillospiraceae bacterium]|nr:translation elongation factor Ts [Oscillospiraceae bacterium]